MNTPRIALIPLDERPVNSRYPQMLGEIGGADVLLPPMDSRGFLRIPADLAVIAGWLRELAQAGVDAAVVSCDFLGYGNLINARISDTSAASVIGRLAVLEELGKIMPVHAFSLLTRVSNADDNVEEPLYWKEWGTKFYSYARLMHRREKEAAVPEAALSGEEAASLNHLTETIPANLLSDWLVRRLRNHAVNLTLVDMAARGGITSLLLTSDDTAAFGFPTRERDWLREWLNLIGEKPAANIRMHPGADEVGSALVAKLINRRMGKAPRVWIDYAIAGDEEIVAPYEDRPVRETVLGQIDACGCVPANSFEECDFVLGVVTPSPRRKDYHLEYLATDRDERGEAYRAFLTRVAAAQKAGKPIAIADVAYPNGSDPLFSEMLLEESSEPQAGSLCAYGAWNTAGNTLGTVVAQAACALYVRGEVQRKAAQNRFLTHRFLEDHGYQQIVRREARAFAEKHWGHREPNPESDEEQAVICALIEGRLNDILQQLQNNGVGLGVSIVCGSTRLPWRRTFEVDFDLTDG